MFGLFDLNRPAKIQTRTRVHVILYHIVGFMFSFVELIYFYGKYL